LQIRIVILLCSPRFIVVSIVEGHLRAVKLPLRL